MPFYPDKNILFIHIPKTGGSRIENQLKKNTKQVLYTPRNNKILPPPFHNVSLQHQYYNTIIDFQKLLNININKNTKIFSVVRNPYDRIISDLFFYKMITVNTTPDEIYNIIKNKYLYNENDNYDNHHKPQFNFVSDKNGVIHPHIKIFKCEELNNLNDELSKFLDVNINVKSPNGNKDYSKYFNKDIITLINEIYDIDFKMFNYTKKNI